MTRYIVVRENDEPFPGTFIAPGCFSAGSDQLPVVYRPLDSSELVELFGQATGFERDEVTGAISFEIELNTDYQPVNAEFGAFATDLIEYDTNDTRIVCKAIIRQVMFIPLPGHPISQKSHGA